MPPRNGIKWRFVCTTASDADIKAVPMPKRPTSRALRTASLVLLALLVMIILLSPAFEMFDKWDGFPNPDKDIVMNVLAVAVCLAVSVSFALLLLQLFFFSVLAGEHCVARFTKLSGRYRPEPDPPPVFCQVLRI
jgi:hypothetical protein